MSAGLEVWRNTTPQTLRFGLGSRPVGLLGLVADTTIHNGSRTIFGLTGAGNPDFIPQPFDPWSLQVPEIKIIGNVLYWTFVTSGHAANCRFRIIYGEW